MKTINYVGNTKKFWESRKKSRDSLDGDFAHRPEGQQRTIMAKMRTHHATMREAKKVS